MAEQLKKRQDVDKNLTWNLEAIFPNEEAFEEAKAKLMEDVKAFQAEFEGQLEQATDTDLILRGIHKYEELIPRMNQVASYASLGFSTDQNNPKWQKLSMNTRAAMDTVSSCLSFFSSELSLIDERLLEECQTLAPEYKIYLGDLIAWKKHQLSKETEKALASLGSTLAFPYTSYQVMKFQDMKFPDFEVHGKSYALSYVLYENYYSELEDTEVRRKAFEVFSETLAKYRNGTAAAYNAQVQKEKTIANLRGFDSVFDYLLFHQKVDKSMYDRQIDVIMTELAPHMRRYVELIKEEYKLEELRYSDLKLTLDPSFSPSVSVEESKAYISNSVKVMGDAYHDLVMRSYDERWVDFAQNEGKSTGGFCSTVRGVQPYILLNWGENLSEIFTLAHELGHAAQGLITSQHNSVFESSFTRYDVEAPSTFHEMLLTKSLLKEDKGERFEKWVLSSMIANTYYHNFVTHLLEAAYQREVYRLVDKGESINADILDDLYLQVLKTFWGDTVVLDDGAKRTWMRQPHYYMGLYSYVYSASLTISTAMFTKVQAEGDGLLEKWIEYLKVGGPTPPAEHAKILGIDITTDQPLRDSIQFIGEMVDRITELSESNV